MPKSKTKPNPNKVCRAIQDIVDYNWKDEERNYQEWTEEGRPGHQQIHHIFEALRLVQTWLNTAASPELLQTVIVNSDALLLNQLITLNHVYGRGEIRSLDLVNQTVFCQLQNGNEHVRYRTKGGVVYFRGHQAKFL